MKKHLSHIPKSQRKIVALDSKETKTSKALLCEDLVEKDNIILIEGNCNVNKFHIQNGYNSIYGECKDILGSQHLNDIMSKVDAIYLDAIGCPETVGELVSAFNNNYLKKNDRCVIGYTFTKRNKKGHTFLNSYNTFFKKFKSEIKNLGFKLNEKPISYSYGNPKKHQANMFTEFVSVTRK